MKDGARAHIAINNGEVFCAWEVQKMLWPACSPDLNAVEHAWAWIRTRVGKVR